MAHILKCTKCNKYTMQETHCGNPAITTKPMRYSPWKNAPYRKEARREELKEKKLL